MQTGVLLKPSSPARSRNCSSPISGRRAISLQANSASPFFAYGEPPFYAQVKRDGARVNLRCVEHPVIDAALRDREQLLAASLTVATTEEIKALFLEFQAARVTFF